MTDAEQQTGRPTEARERMCALTRAPAAREDLVRFVESPDGEVVPDLKECLPGRGMWLGLSRDVIAQAIKKRLFGRALRADVKVPDDLAGRIGQLLKRDCLATLSLAAKAGRAVGGVLCWSRRHISSTRNAPGRGHCP